MLEELGVLLVVGPVSLREHLYRKVDFKLFTRWVALELLAELVRHLHVFEHDLEALRELTPALFFELEHERSLRLFADLSLFKQTLRETADIETLKDVFVEQVSENVNDFVQALSQFRLIDILEVLLEHLVEVEDECLGRTIINIDDFLKSHLNCHVNLSVLLHGPILHIADSLTKVDHF